MIKSFGRLKSKALARGSPNHERLSGGVVTARPCSALQFEGLPYRTTLRMPN